GELQLSRPARYRAAGGSVVRAGRRANGSGAEPPQPAALPAGGQRPGGRRPASGRLRLRPRSTPRGSDRGAGRQLPRGAAAADRALRRSAGRRAHAVGFPARRAGPGPARPLGGEGAAPRGRLSALAAAAGPAVPRPVPPRILCLADELHARRGARRRGAATGLAGGGRPPSHPAHLVRLGRSRAAVAVGASPGRAALGGARLAAALERARRATVAGVARQPAAAGFRSRPRPPDELDAGAHRRALLVVPLGAPSPADRRLDDLADPERGLPRLYRGHGR